MGNIFGIYNPPSASSSLPQSAARSTGLGGGVLTGGDSPRGGVPRFDGAGLRVDKLEAGDPYNYNNNAGEVVVIPVDGSKEADVAFEWYMTRLHRPENKVYVINCQEIAQASGKHFPQYAIAPEDWSEKVRLARIDGRTMLDAYHEKMKRNKMQGSVYSEIGKPGPMVVKTAEQLNATMVVMGTRGFGILRRTIIGSVSTYVIQHTDIPVTVVPRHRPSVFF